MKVRYFIYNKFKFMLYYALFVLLFSVLNVYAGTDGYICEKSSNELLTEKDISDMSIQILHYAKNEIYARHGRRFKSEELQSYFDSCEWYTGIILPDEFDESSLSSIERDNVQFLIDAELFLNDMEYQCDQPGYSIDNVIEYVEKHKTWGIPQYENEPGYTYDDENDNENYAETDGTRVLMDVTDVDFLDGKYSSKKSFLGNSEISRKNIEKVVFEDSLDILEEKDGIKWDVSEAKDNSVVACAEKHGKRYIVTIAANGSVRANPYSQNLFRSCKNLIEVEFNGHFDTSDVLEMNHMFSDCFSLKEVYGIEYWDTSKTYMMYALFENCKSLNVLDLRFCDFSQLSDAQRMFYGCKSLSNLYLNNNQFPEKCNIFEIYDSTPFEGSSPLIELGSEILENRYILNTSYCTDHPKLRVALINAYDDYIYELIKDKIDFQGWNDDENRLYYAIQDLDEDKIPELILREDHPNNEYYYSMYRFDPVRCMVRSISAWIPSDWTRLDYGNGVILLSTKGGDRLLKIHDGKTEDLNTEVNSIPKMNSVEFSFALPEEKWYTMYDLTGDGVSETIQAIASKNSSNLYNYLCIYVDSDLVYNEKLRPSDMIDLGCYSTVIQSENKLDDENYDISGTEVDEMPDGFHSYLYIHTFTEEGKVCSLMEFIKGKLQSALSLEDLVDESLINLESSYFIPDITPDKKLQISFYLSTIELGELQFTMNFAICKDGTFAQSTFISDIEKMWSGGKNATVLKNIIVYDSMFAKDNSRILDQGTHVVFKKIWLYGRKLWVLLKDELKKEGWIPLINGRAFREVGMYLDGTTDIDLNDNYRIEPPDVPSNTLFNLGKSSLEKKCYGDAKLYFSFINKEDTLYKQGQELLSAYQHDNKIEDDEIDSTGTVRNNALSIENQQSACTEFVYQKEEDNDGYSEYAIIDINNDGNLEVILKYTSGYDANCEIYSFDTVHGNIVYVGEVENVIYSLYYSLNEPCIINYMRTSGSEEYQFYAYDGHSLEHQYDVGKERIMLSNEIEAYDFYIYKDGVTNEIGWYAADDDRNSVDVNERYQSYLSNIVIIDFEEI